MNTTEITATPQTAEAYDILVDTFVRDQIRKGGNTIRPRSHEASAHTRGICNLLREICHLGNQNDERVNTLEYTSAPHSHGITITVSNPERDRAVRYRSVGINNTYEASTTRVDGEKVNSFIMPEELTKKTSRAYGKRIGEEALEYLIG